MKESNSMPVPLNPDQQRIIEHRKGPALVIAGAGSGKTRVVTQRVAHLIRSGVPASSILLLTFTQQGRSRDGNSSGKEAGSGTRSAKNLEWHIPQHGQSFSSQECKTASL